jgi:hypothetical protein
VAGIVDYLIFTMFIPRPGWLIYFFFYIFISMKNIVIFNRKRLISFSASLRKRSQINHPGRKKLLQYFDYLALRPPLLQKEGKYYEHTEPRYSNTFFFVEPPSIIFFRLLKLRAMPLLREITTLNTCLFYFADKYILNGR